MNFQEQVDNGFRLEGDQVLLGDRVLGVVERTMHGVVYKTRRRAQHFMVREQGFGLSNGVIDLLLERFMRDIEVVIDYYGKHGHVYYTAPLSSFIKSSREYVDSTFCEGDKQKFLSVDELLRIAPSRGWREGT